MKLSLNTITFESYSACNLRCVYCYNTWKRPEGDAPFRYSHRQAVKTLKEIYRQADITQLSITGGEPLLNEYVAELILTAKLKGSKVSIISNGNGVKDGDYTLYRDLDVDLFLMPLHAASSSIHDSMTQVEGSWQRSLSSITSCAEMGFYVVPVVVLTRLNAPQIEETLRFISNLGLKRIMVNRYNIGGAGINHQSLSLGHDELRQAFGKINRISEELTLNVSSNVCTPFCVLNPADYPSIAFGACSPDPFRRPLTVDVMGNLRTCNHSPIVAGNIFKDRIEDIVNTPYMKSWNDTTPTFCEQCAMYAQCRGGCRAASEQLGLTLRHVDPLVTMQESL
ncbi:radical SAM/SPASM domain-containing protein [uncultured Acetobacteroides sp.]|uniref:radical SAM/SPASM domain-containing protein n=1 Tax=uncultured Acetobacteroides sp. TaxID=1760811 RepID=UPI0029F4F9ED|nr:radical SAM protein [uncultured Acetobacteroides sp.]